MENLSSLQHLVTTVAGRHSYPLEDSCVLILPLNHGATFYFEPGFYRDPEDREQDRRVEDLFLEASGQLIQGGAFFDCPYLLWAKEVYIRASLYHSKIKEIKEMVDPNNIMNPRKRALT